MDLRQTAEQIFPELAQKQRTFLIAGVVGLAVSLAGFAMDAEHFYQAYLIGYMFVLGLTLGGLGFTMIHQLSGGAWGVVARQSLGAASRVLPLLTALFFPIVVGMPHLYEWTHADKVAADPILQGKALYLNTNAFIMRAVIYFAVWNGLVFLLNKLSADQDRTGDPAVALKMQRVSGIGMLLFVLTVTFASFDWLMSRDPHWFSTIYGALVLAGQALITLAFQIIVLVWLSKKKPMSQALTATYLHDLSTLMFGFTVVWAYFSFSQYLIIWSGNLPEEILWYIHREQSGWFALSFVLVLFHFIVPFAILLSRHNKRAGQVVTKVAALIILARLLDLFWLIAPETGETHGFSLTWMDLLVPAALLSVWVSFYFGQLRKRPLLPIHDLQFEDALGPIFAHAGSDAGAAH